MHFIVLKKTFYLAIQRPLLAASRRHQQAVNETVEAMENPLASAIYEASFLYEDVRVKVNILARLGKGKWNLNLCRPCWNCFRQQR